MLYTTHKFQSMFQSTLANSNNGNMCFSKLAKEAKGARPWEKEQMYAHYAQKYYFSFLLMVY